MLTPLMLIPLLSLAQAPMPRPIQVVSEVNKGDKLPPAIWTEIPADPILTTLVNPTSAKWISVDDGCELRPASDGKSCVFAAVKAGRYRLIVVPETGDVMRVAIVVGKIDPPTPPTPPGPTPPPVPADPLTEKFQAAYGKDSRDAAKKKTDLLDLIELYKQAGELASATDVSTTGQLVSRVRDASKALAIAGLEDLRRAISVELATAMPADVALTQDLRTKAAATFTKIKTALQGVQ